MAEYILKDMVEKMGLRSQFEIASAATSDEEIWNGIGNPVYPPARQELIRHGIGGTPYTDFSGKQACRVTRSDYQYYDYLLCADTLNIRDTVRITGPDRDQKIHLLLDFAGRPGCSVADPWYSRDFTAAWNDIEEGCEGFLAYLGYGRKQL